MICVDPAVAEKCMSDIRQALAAFEAATGERVVAIEIYGDPVTRMDSPRPELARRIELRLAEHPTYLPFQT